MNIHRISDDPTQASRYLADQLTEAECAEYEAGFAQNPDTVAEIEATARLKIGLHRLRESGELGELIAAGNPSGPGRTFILALAASIAAVALGIAIWLPRSGAPGAVPVLASAATAFKDRGGHSLAVVSTTPLFRTRAESYDAVIELPATRGAIKLRVLPSATPPAAVYDASLSRMRADDSPERIVSVTNLKPSSDDGFIDLYADSALLAPGRYRLILTPHAAGAASGDSDAFVIKVAATAH